jgi:hypothetical protein
MIGEIVGGLLGGVFGSGGGGESSATQQMKMDPRMDRFVYGDSGKGGLLGDAHKLYSQQMAQGGMNPMMQGGMEAQRQFLLSQQYGQGQNNLMNVGQGLLGAGVAGNAFTQGNQVNGRMSQANMKPFMGQGHLYQPNTEFMGMMSPVQPQAVKPSDLSQPEETTPEKSAIEKLGTYGKAMFDQFKALGMTDEQAYRMAMNYGSSGFDGGN